MTLPEYLKPGAADRAAREVFSKWVRLPIIRQPAAIFVSAVDQLRKSMKRIDDQVVSQAPRGFNWVYDKMRRDRMDMEKAGHPQISEPEIKEKQLKRMQLGREYLERDLAVAELAAEKLREALALTRSKLEKEAADNVFLEGIIDRIYAPLLNNHRTVKRLHRTPRARSAQGDLDFCPTCDLLHTIEELLRHRRDVEVKT